MADEKTKKDKSPSKAKGKNMQIVGEEDWVRKMRDIGNLGSIGLTGVGLGSITQENFDKKGDNDEVSNLDANKLSLNSNEYSPITKTNEIFSVDNTEDSSVLKDIVSPSKIVEITPPKHGSDKKVVIIESGANPKKKTDKNEAEVDEDTKRIKTLQTLKETLLNLYLNDNLLWNMNDITVLLNNFMVLETLVLTGNHFTLDPD